MMPDKDLKFSEDQSVLSKFLNNVFQPLISIMAKESNYLPNK